MEIEDQKEYRFNNSLQKKSGIDDNLDKKKYAKMDIEENNNKLSKKGETSFNEGVSNESTNIETTIDLSKDKSEILNKTEEAKQKEKEKGQNKKIEIFPTENDKINDIECPHCFKQIKLKPDLIDKYKLNCLNVRCPLDFCAKFFFLSICPKCQSLQKIPKLILEGEMIRCSKKDCSFQYIQTCCPVINCQEVFYFTNPKAFNNAPNGVLHSHKGLLIFQKISCVFCYRPIVYYTPDKKQVNRYFETMRVTCPYEDCKKIFNRIVCPKCNEVNFMVLGLYVMGTRIKCAFCNFVFAKILCPMCLKVNPLIKNEFKYGEFECRYNSCSKKCLIANCLHCQRINYYNQDKKIGNEKGLIPGQLLKCGYKDCNKKFCSVICSGCNEINPFPNGDFVFGKPYKCKYSAICNKIFIILVCPKCFSYSKIYDESEGKKYTCNVCNTLLANFQCPFCFISILDRDSFFNFGQMIECPNCKKHFSFFRCWNCKRLINSKENECILGKAVNCNHCKKYSVNVICPKCLSKITFSKRTENVPLGEKISCPNCQSVFEFSDKLRNGMEKLYNKNLSFIKELEGMTINFGNSLKDESYLERKNNFPLDLNEKDFFVENTMSSNISTTNVTKIYEDMGKKINNNLCIICQSNNKESIFFPCGHRCSCYKCAVYYYEVFKKCPRCLQNATGIIPKIFNV